MKPRGQILVAGIGSIFSRDEAFGSEVARELRYMAWPDHVRVEDFGIRGDDLADALMETSAAILITAAPRGYPPGTVYLIEPDLDNLSEVPLGGTTARVYIVGCEPGAPAAAVVPEAVALVERVIADLMYNRNPIPVKPSTSAATVTN